MSRRAKEEFHRSYAVSDPRGHPKGYTEYKVTAKVRKELQREFPPPGPAGSGEETPEMPPSPKTVQVREAMGGCSQWSRRSKAGVSGACAERREKAVVPPLLLFFLAKGVGGCFSPSLPSLSLGRGVILPCYHHPLCVCVRVCNADSRLRNGAGEDGGGGLCPQAAIAGWGQRRSGHARGSWP